MKSIRTKITMMTVCAVSAAMIIAMVLGAILIRSIGDRSSDKLLNLLCETGEKNLDYYFNRVEQSVEMVSAYVKTDLDGIDDAHLQAHLDRVSDIFKKMTNKENDILTYYYRIDPAVSTAVKGFWYVNLDGDGFVEHEVTDITLYDTSDTSRLVWFTVPKFTGKAVWLPPYITDNLDVRVLSYNVPIYFGETFVGVVGIEIDYSLMADQVDNIILFENGYAFINDKDGNIIYHPRIDVIKLEEEGKPLPTTPSGMLDGKSVEYTYDGVKKLAARLQLSNGMFLTVSVPVNEVNADWHRWILITVAVFVALIVPFIIFAKRFSDHITKPLRDLTDAAIRVDNGDYTFIPDYKGKDEVGILTNTFGMLTSHLKSYIGYLNDLAYADALTAVHNKGAFNIYLEDLQKKVDEEGKKDFAVCVFDCNDLKKVNDEFGHDKGDVYLRAACALICKVFAHSPVFRTGGDEFATVLQGGDFKARNDLISVFDDQCRLLRTNASDRWEQVDIARGIAVFDPQIDRSVNDVVHRADMLMYEDKRNFKGKER